MSRIQPFRTKYKTPYIIESMGRHRVAGAQNLEEVMCPEIASHKSQGPEPNVCLGKEMKRVRPPLLVPIPQVAYFEPVAIVDWDAALLLMQEF